jgi:hypothetical protein
MKFNEEKLYFELLRLSFYLSLLKNSHFKFDFNKGLFYRRDCLLQSPINKKHLDILKNKLSSNFKHL